MLIQTGRTTDVRRKLQHRKYLPGRAEGFSLVEMIFVVGIMGVLGTMALFQIASSQPILKGDGAMRVVLAQLNAARELSIGQRRQMQVNFVGSNQIQIVRLEIPNGTTTLSTVPFEGGVTFMLTPGLPDTPDHFGNFGATYFGAAQKVLFNSDGTLIDQAGNPLNGTIFTGLVVSQRAARAVTVLGGTGRIRGYRWDGRQWVLV